ncbi:two-component sensor histidine kinase BarA [Enterovibrio norvegicus]|uniref:two-component sensor histidine kinase BarA n=1 Tax=Enterovibrio norvegicus TaxID=188144 RepID=UPI0010BEA06A|nr:two-component sensor histidine kinase BarA [Enterovibrio norvegicus]TKF16359.1 two-component sensor histidine kinase BarA [Enterovibrio norvegicus]TKF30459.1 two-component sensor histidine kinase BarA [Enterovibrio norvegicus]
MTKYGLRARVITLTIAPTLIVGVLLSAIFISNRYQELENQLSVTGQAIIEPLAIASEIGLANESRENVRRLIGHTHKQFSKYVRSIAVFSGQNDLFVTSNYHHNLDSLAVQRDLPIPSKLQVVRLQDSLLLRAPIRAIGRFNTNLDNEQPIGYIAMEMDLSSVRLQQYQEVIAVCVVLLLGIILSSFFAYRLLMDVTHPITQMVNMIDRIRRGHLDVRIEGKLLGELDTLKNGINAMAISLSEYHLEMQQSIDQATSDLRETLEQLEIQNVELDIAKKNAQEAARVKSEFLANMSHELRTPLNGVIGFTRQMLKTQLSSSQQDYLLTIEKSANNLLTIINDILDFSKLEAGKLLLENIPFDFEDSLDEVMRLLAPMAHEKGLELNLRIDPRIPPGVIGDPLRIQQVLTNLIGNATKFTERGHINVSVELKQYRDENLELQFVIRDTGIGISERQQAQLFQAFRQADTSISRRYGGTGLGLVITQKLVQRMGGDIGFNSRLHQGSTFWFTLSLMHTDLPLIQPIDGTALQGKSLLLIEPDGESRHVLSERLTQLGLVVHSYPKRPDTFERTTFALYCIDANDVPEPEQLLDWASNADDVAEKVIFCLPTTELALSEQLLQSGVAACLAKPLSVRKLIEQLQGPVQEPKLLPPVTEVHLSKTPVTVMAVDDNPANLKLITALLKERVAHVVTASDGTTALEKAKERHFDLILMDIQMPEMDGVTASQEIRKTPLNQYTPIVAVTAHAMSGERERLISEGMDDYLTKPIEEHILEQVLHQWTHTHAEAFQPTTPLIASNNGNMSLSVDWSLAMKQAAGKEALAKEMLHMLVRSFSAVEDIVQRSLNGEVIDLLPVIHKLHGSCAYSGVPKLKKLCFDLESALKANASIEDVEPELLELMDELDNIRQQAEPYLENN